MPNYIKFALVMISENKTQFLGRSREFMNFGPPPTSKLFDLSSETKKSVLSRKMAFHEQVPNTNIKGT
jgi:hypothetical protein